MIQRWEIRENTVNSNSVYMLVIIGTNDDASVLQRNLSVFSTLTGAKLPPFTHVFELANITDDDMLEKIRVKIEEAVAESGSEDAEAAFSSASKKKPLNLDAVSPATEIISQDVQFSRVGRGGTQEPLEYTTMPQTSSNIFDATPGPSLNISDEETAVKTKSHFALAKDELFFKKEFEGLNSDIELDNDLDVGDGTFIDLDTASVKKLRETTADFNPEAGLSGLLKGAKTQTMMTQRSSAKMPSAFATKKTQEEVETVRPEPAPQVAEPRKIARPEVQMPSLPENTAAGKSMVGGSILNKIFSRFSSTIRRSVEAVSSKAKKPEVRPTQVEKAPANNPFSSLKSEPKAVARGVNTQAVEHHSVVVEETAAPIKGFAKNNTVHKTPTHDEGFLTDEIFSKANQSDLNSKMPVDDIFAAETICEFYADDDASAPSFSKVIDPSVQEIISSTPAKTAPAMGDSLLDIPENLFGSADSGSDLRRPVMSSMAPEPIPVPKPKPEVKPDVKPKLVAPKVVERVNAEPVRVDAPKIDKVLEQAKIEPKAAAVKKAAFSQPLKSVPLNKETRPKPMEEAIVKAAPKNDFGRDLTQQADILPTEQRPDSVAQEKEEVKEQSEIIDLMHPSVQAEPAKKHTEGFNIDELAEEDKSELTSQEITREDFGELMPARKEPVVVKADIPPVVPPKPEPKRPVPPLPTVVKKQEQIKQEVKIQAPNRPQHSGESKSTMTQDDSFKITNLARKQEPKEGDSSSQVKPSHPGMPPVPVSVKSEAPAMPSSNSVAPSAKVVPPAFKRPLGQAPAVPGSNIRSMPGLPGAVAKPQIQGVPSRPQIPQQPARPVVAPVSRPVVAAVPARPAVVVQRPAVQRPQSAPSAKTVLGAEKTKTIDHTIQIAIGQIYKKSNWPLEIPLNPTFTFDTMDMASNRFAHATAMSVIENLGTMNNPFVIYGEGGSGKTHFLNAMGYDISKKISQEKIFMTNGVRFARGIQRYVEEGKTEKLQDFFDSAEVMIIDDIHLTAVNEHNREFISQILSKFLKEKKQLIISSKYPPESLARFEDLVKFRLDQGWVSELKPPRPQHFTRLYNRMVDSAELGLSEVQSHSFFGGEALTLGTISRDIRRIKVLHRRITDSGSPEKSYESLLNDMLAVQGENEGSEIIKKDFGDIISLQRGENTDWGSFGFFFPQDQADKFKWIAWATMQRAKELGIKGGFNFALKSAYSTEHIISSAFKIANICDNKNLKGAIILGPSLSTCAPAIRDNFYDILSHMLEVMMIRCGIVDAEFIKSPSAYVRVLGDVLK